VNVREVLNAIFYALSTGCQWNALPKDLPPKSTVYGYLDLWDRDGTLERIHYALYVEVRERAGREASLTTAIIDSQSAKGAAKGGASIDTLGLLLNVVVHPADVQDRDGALDLSRPSRRLFPFVERIYADGGYRGPKMAGAVARTGVWQIEIVNRPTLARFDILPKCWIVERTFAWISRCRRLAKDFERNARTTADFVRLAMIRLMLRRLAAMPQS